jgi:flagellum-specific ATP synthase
MSELIRLGAYKKGSDPKVDRAIDYIDDLENFLAQKPEERASVDDGFDHLAAALDMNDSTNDVEPGENDGEA